MTAIRRTAPNNISGIESRQCGTLPAQLNIWAVDKNTYERNPSTTRLIRFRSIRRRGVCLAKAANKFRSSTPAASMSVQRMLTDTGAGGTGLLATIPSRLRSVSCAATDENVAPVTASISRAAASSGVFPAYLSNTPERRTRSQNGGSSAFGRNSTAAIRPVAGSSLILAGVGPLKPVISSAAGLVSRTWSCSSVAAAAGAAETGGGGCRSSCARK